MTADPVEVSLFDVEHLGQMPKVRDMTIAPVSSDDIREFVRRYHYSGTSNSHTWRWGLWCGPTLLGVIAYNLPTRVVCESVFGDEHFDKVWHMGRLAMAETAPRNSESRLIGLSLRAITKQHPEVWGVLSYADMSEGHIGTVYQATNALYTGTGGHMTYCLDAGGNRRSRNQHGRWISEAKAAAAGWTIHKGAAKHRYLYLLGNKSQRRQRRRLLKLPVLPYPKVSTQENGPALPKQREAITPGG